MADQELKACVFCQSTNLKEGSTGPGSAYVMCMSCCAEGPVAINRDLAIAAWNTRSEPAVQNVQAGDEHEVFESYMRLHKPTFPLEKRVTVTRGIDYISAGTQHMFNGFCAALKSVAPSQPSQGNGDHLAASGKPIAPSQPVAVQSNAVQLFREAISWGSTYGPALSAKDYEELRDQCAEQCASKLTTANAGKEAK